LKPKKGKIAVTSGNAGNDQQYYDTILRIRSEQGWSEGTMYLLALEFLGDLEITEKYLIGFVQYLRSRQNEENKAEKLLDDIIGDAE
jgi:hypothetical protein